MRIGFVNAVASHNLGPRNSFSNSVYLELFKINSLSVGTWERNVARMSTASALEKISLLHVPFIVDNIWSHYLRISQRGAGSILLRSVLVFRPEIIAHNFLSDTVCDLVGLADFMHANYLETGAVAFWRIGWYQFPKNRNALVFPE